MMTDPVNKPVLLSVNIITYNHENYIVETLESVLMQKTNFLFDVVICDDYSTDGTRAIVESYQNKYPAKIKLRFRDKNVGLKYNYFDNINACAGKYVAICEGDDFWTDENKLQKQVDFLDAHPAYSMCFHSAFELHEIKGHQNTMNVFSQLEDRDYSGEDILSNWLIPTASVVFRKNFDFTIQYLDNFLFYDIVLFLKLCDQGKIYCMNEIMCVYRRHPGSITNSGLSYKDYIKHLIHINSEFKGKYASTIKKAIAVEYLKQAKCKFKQRSISFIAYVLKSFRYDVVPFIRVVQTKIA